MRSWIEQSTLDRSYTSLVSSPDRTREPSYSWGERLCEYSGWNAFSRDVDDLLAERGIDAQTPLASTQYSIPFIMGTVTGSATDLDIRARETIRLREELNELYAEHTGQDVEKIAKDTDRDFFMSAAEGKEYGLLDDVITTTEPAPNGQVKS